ncbi:hypothetical protein [Frankia sp. Cppng1_Ct_nod]|uniref:hypothetical protein n=1 Tax=Frankia sp. Cppng1_Ct_nod TaxID=2897162 RepID=UPI00202563B2|nr:hypothetical protein [Frankia sp. Cppng1_Ct_nod]
MMDEQIALRFQLVSETAHWRTATVGLTDLENFASPQAWQAVETYLGLGIRRHLQELVRTVAFELDAVEADIRAAGTLVDLQRARRRLQRFRERYLQAETVLEFYGHAIRSRTTTRLAQMLTACDILARQSMAAPLAALGLTPPPVLVYLDRGLGASILRAHLRYWSGASVSPAAAIKVTRFNLFRPTSLLHEAGHQVAHLTGWNNELPAMLRRGVPDAAVAELWAGWATELGPDLLAFAHAGYGAVAALHDVVAGERTQVFAHPIGDPHPIAWLRVLVGVEMCVRFYGAGPWDTLKQAMIATYPLSDAPPSLRSMLERSVAQLPKIVDIGLRSRMRAYGGRALADVVDPVRVGPAALDDLARTAGPALTTSTHYLTSEGLRLLARSALQVAVYPERAQQTTQDFEDWMRRLGKLAVAAAAPAASAA